MKTVEKKPRGFLARPIPLYFFLIFLATLSGMFYFFYQRMEKQKDAEIITEVNKIDNVSQRLLLDNEYKLIRPLAFVDFTREDSLLMSIKNKVSQYIIEKKKDGTITSASVYLRNLNRHQDVKIFPNLSEFLL